MLKKHLPIIIVLAIGSVLLFTNLANQYLWQDEAETAVLAKNTLKYGFPRGFDGKNTVNPRIRTGLGENYSWKYHPWAQFYITASSFAVLGINTFSARIPFAFIGLLTLLLLYILATHITGNRFVAVCSVIITTGSVQYLLLMRQCRYYSPAVFLCLFMLIFYWNFLKTRQTRDLALSALGAVALAYTVHGMFVPMCAALSIHYITFSRDKKDVRRILLTVLAVAALVLPWFLFSSCTSHIGHITAEKVYKNLEFQVRMINKFIFPMFFMGGVYVARLLWKKKWKFDITPEERHALGLIATVILANVAAFAFAEERNFRYLVYFIPLLAIVQGLILLRVWRLNRWLASILLAISLFTGVFNMGTPSCYLPKYLYEITHDYDGPIEGIAKFLKDNGDPGDTVKIVYGDIPLMFYTDMAVDNSWTYDRDHMPKWIVFRRGWHETLDNGYYSHIRQNYEQHIIPYPDIMWENRPGDLGYHRFATDNNAPRVIIFERPEQER